MILVDQNQKPGNGFSIQKEASNVPVNDPYRSYEQSVVDDDAIWQSLTTEAGRQALGAQMAVPIREELDYVGVARKFFEIDVLAQGQIARYDKDVNVLAFFVSKRGRVSQLPTGRHARLRARRPHGHHRRRADDAQRTGRRSKAPLADQLPGDLSIG